MAIDRTLRVDVSDANEDGRDREEEATFLKVARPERFDLPAALIRGWPVLISDKES